MSAPLTPLAALLAAPAEVHPVLVLAWELQDRERRQGAALTVEDLIDLAPLIAQAQETVQPSTDRSTHLVRRLMRVQPVAATTVPEGF